MIKAPTSKTATIHSELKSSRGSQFTGADLANTINADAGVNIPGTRMIPSTNQIPWLTGLTLILTLPGSSLPSQLAANEFNYTDPPRGARQNLRQNRATPGNRAGSVRTDARDLLISKIHQGWDAYQMGVCGGRIRCLRQ